MNSTVSKRGRGRGRGRPRGASSRRSLSTIFERTEIAPGPQPSTSTSIPQSELERIRSQRILTNKRIRALPPATKKTLISAKRKKELNRFLLPDAPESKRKRQGTSSPPRMECPMAAVPSTSATTYLPVVSPLLQTECKTPSSGGSMASVMEVESLSPHYWRGGIQCSIEVITEDCEEVPGSPEHNSIEVNQSFIRSKPKITILSDILIQPPSNPPTLADLPNIVALSNTASPPNLLPIESASKSSDKEEEEKLASLAPAVLPLEPNLLPIASASECSDREEEKKLKFLAPAVLPLEPNLSPTESASESDSEEECSDREEQKNFASLAPAVLPLEFGRAQERALGMADLADDRALRELAPPDLLEFNWSKDPQTFQGTRESFTGTAGPTFTLSDLSCPLDAFRKIWDDEFLDLIVRRTNSYAAERIASIGPLQKNSRYRNWTPTDRPEIIRFLAICQLHSLAYLPVQKDYFKTVGYCAMPEMASIMSYGRFILIKRFLHFADPLIARDDLTDQQKRLLKIKPVIDHLTDKFKTLYMPGQSIAIDESLLLWKGRLAFAQKIGNKAAKVGIKTFELCESATGYLWNFYVYGGAAKNEQKDRHSNDRAGTQTDRQQDDEPDTDIQDETDRQNIMPDGATAKVVYDLARPLFNLGHTLIMDNYYNSPLLARCLKKQKTDLLGTLRVNREFVPESIKSMVKTEMRVGEIACSNTNDLTILLWRDSNLISVLSTYHKVEVAPKEKYGKVKYKPQAVLDYNVLMGGVDKKDQLLSAYSLERTRNQVWYKKLFLRLMNVSILNAYILYKCKFNIGHRRFRHNLAEALVAASQMPAPSTSVQATLVHSTAKDRPKLTGNHFIAKGPSKYSVCIWCRMYRNRKTRTVYVCDQCGVSLCLENCFKEYHTV